jgi:ADP-ribose pyrophosphatase YjhB (NUDIX family)
MTIPSPRPLQPLVHASVAVMDGGRVLLVREEKPDVRGRWNLPGGHVERGESVLAAARRELAEETALAAALEALVGIYSGPTSIRFVFRTRHDGRPPVAGDEIMEVGFAGLAEIRAWPDEALAGAGMLRRIFDDLAAGRSFPLAAFR